MSSQLTVSRCQSRPLFEQIVKLFQQSQVFYRQGSWHRHQCPLDGEECCLVIDIDAHVELHLEVEISHSLKSQGEEHHRAELCTPFFSANLAASLLNC